MITSYAAPIPLTSRMAVLAKNAYFADCYQAPLHHCETPSQAYQAIFAYTPAWVRTLMRLRNVIAAKLGLKTLNQTQMREAELSIFNLPYQVGERAGIFFVQTLEPLELIVGGDDRHLNFQISVFIHIVNTQRMVAVSTVVMPNHWLGRVYMTLIKPFHRLIANHVVKVAHLKGRL